MNYNCPICGVDIENSCIKHNIDVEEYTKEYFECPHCKQELTIYMDETHDGELLYEIGTIE